MIAVASGKGGTGKTTIAAHLARAGDAFGKTLLVDLDVEAPDAIGYFPGAERREGPGSVTVTVPRLKREGCDGCGICTTSCRFGAIVVDLEIRDCPPGVTCPATHAIEGADYVVLVAEPTEFSLHDLEAALRLVRSRRIPAGVVVNKDGFGSADVEALCSRNGVSIIGRIPFLMARAETGAAARLWIDDKPFMEEMGRIVAIARSESWGR